MGSRDSRCPRPDRAVGVSPPSLEVLRYSSRLVCTQYALRTVFAPIQKISFSVQRRVDGSSHSASDSHGPDGPSPLSSLLGYHLDRQHDARVIPVRSTGCCCSGVAYPVSYRRGQILLFLCAAFFLYAAGMPPFTLRRRLSNIQRPKA